MTPLSRVAAVQTVSRVLESCGTQMFSIQLCSCSEGQIYILPGGHQHCFDPLQLLPERWMSGWEPEPWQFISFSGGPRICIRNKLAIVDLGYIITRILQEYEQIMALPASGKETVDDPVLWFGGGTFMSSSVMNCGLAREVAGNKMAEDRHL